MTTRADLVNIVLDILGVSHVDMIVERFVSARAFLESRSGQNNLIEALDKLADSELEFFHTLLLNNLTER